MKVVMVNDNVFDVRLRDIYGRETPVAEAYVIPTSN